MPEWYEYFWIGLASVFAILQIWSFFLPVNIYALIFITVIAFFSAIVILRNGIKLPKINFKFLICVGFILFVISYFASLSVWWPDTQGYHLNAVKWANMYKIVPGLANLHSRLGFNSSFFLFASMTDNILKDRSSHVALSLITSVLSIEFLWVFFKSKSKYLKIFSLLVLPVVVSNVVKINQIASLSYDFALLIVILAICIELINGRKESLILAGILSIMLVTIKLSGAVFSLVVLAYIAHQIFIKKYLSQKLIFIFIAFGIVMLVPYLIRNIILSGWPFYPMPLLKFNVVWAVPREKVVALYEIIKAWAILPGTQWHDAVGMPVWKWFPIWFTRNGGAFELKIFLVSVIFLISSLVLKFVSREKVVKNIGLVACGLASIASILYLMISAPELRFGGIFFWILFASSGSFFFTEFFKKYPKIEKWFLTIPLLLLVLTSWPPKLNGEIMLKSIRWEQSLTGKQIEIIPSDGSTPFKVYVPDKNDSCGNSPLPCTPEINSDFREIVPGDISKGFAPVK